MGTWRTLHPQRILHALGAINLYGGVLPGDPRTRSLWSEVEYSSDLPTAGLILEGINLNYFKNMYIYSII